MLIAILIRGTLDRCVGNVVPFSHIQTRSEPFLRRLNPLGVARAACARREQRTRTERLVVRIVAIRAVVVAIRAVVVANRAVVVALVVEEVVVVVGLP
jgi:hypothetical protein